MPTLQPPPATIANTQSGVEGWRAVVELRPSPTSDERLCAGVVINLGNGVVMHQCAIDPAKAQHAFGIAGAALHDVAQRLCDSLADHWRTQPNAMEWTPPFSNARISSLQEFSAASAESALALSLSRNSSLHTLLAGYTIEKNKSSTGIVARVKTALRKDVNAKHLQKRFEREIPLGEDGGSFKVDFLGAHFACYFVQLPQSTRTLEMGTERSLGRLAELAALRRFVQKPKKSLGLLDDERPAKFELVLVGSMEHPVQRRAMSMITALADRNEIRARPLRSADQAAHHVAHMEKQAA